jgi:DNA-binding response OmpR family regulator
MRELPASAATNNESNGPKQIEKSCAGDAGGREINKGTFVTQPKKVLIIEDEVIFAENLQTHLRRCGWDARIAGTGELAVMAADEFRPEVILLDYNLPDMNGFQALDAIRAAHPSCDCVLMTGRPDETVLAEAQRHGIGRVMCKPFSLEGLVSLL